MNFFQAIQTGYDRYSDFEGRASRSEFWYFALYVSIASTLLSSIYFSTFQGNSFSIWLFFFIQLFGFTIPHLAVFSRRMHDINKSGWWYLLIFTVVGTPILLYWLCLKGSSNKNKYGVTLKLFGKKSLAPKSRQKIRSTSKNNELQINLNKNTITYALLICSGFLFLYLAKNSLHIFSSGTTHSLSSVREYYCPTKDDMYACSSACEYKWSTYKDDRVVIDVSSNSVTKYEWGIDASTGSSELRSYTLKQCYFNDRNNWTCLDDYQNEYAMRNGRFTETLYISSKPLYICFSDGLFNLFK